jgi:hypothetical protein
MEDASYTPKVKSAFNKCIELAVSRNITIAEQVPFSDIFDVAVRSVKKIYGDHLLTQASKFCYV